MRFFIFLIIGYVSWNQILWAKEAVEKIAEHGAWKVFKGTEGKDSVCFMQSVPVKEEGTFLKRKKPLLTVTSRPGKKEFNVVNITVGYPFKKESEGSVSIVIGKGKIIPFKLFTHEETAWAEDEKMDTDLVKAMRSGRTLTMEGVSSKETKSKDIYSLDGFSKAHEVLSEACSKS